PARGLVAEPDEGLGIPELQRLGLVVRLLRVAVSGELDALAPDEDRLPRRPGDGHQGCPSGMGTDAEGGVAHARSRSLFVTPAPPGRGVPGTRAAARRPCRGGSPGPSPRAPLPRTSCRTAGRRRADRSRTRATPASPPRSSH